MHGIAHPRVQRVPDDREVQLIARHADFSLFLAVNDLREERSPLAGRDHRARHKKLHGARCEASFLKQRRPDSGRALSPALSGVAGAAAIATHCLGLSRPKTMRPCGACYRIYTARWLSDLPTHHPRLPAAFKTRGKKRRVGCCRALCGSLGCPAPS